MEKDFYENQDDLTAAKIEIYKSYIEGYLFKLLMSFGQCFIADLFCGPGKQGQEKGSPLVLLEKIEYALKEPKLRVKKPKIYIFFNDKNAEHIKALNDELGQRNIPSNIIILPVRNNDFKKVLEEIENGLKNKSIPKFFFLDPFTCSNIKIQDLNSLMSLKNVEILLFLPILHAYRFKNVDFSKEHETRAFIERFTTKGIYNYENVHEFNDSIKEKIKQELKIKYVRPIVLDFGSRKNSLFLITKNRKGMLLMNQIAFKKSEDGSGINIRYRGKQNLWGIKGTTKFKLFTENLEEKLRAKKKLSNDEINDYAIAEGFLPKHAKEILKILKKDKRIAIFDLDGNEINSVFRAGIAAEKTKIMTIFKYIS